MVDQAGSLGPELRNRLADRLRRFQRDTGHQFAIVTVASLDGEDVATFTTRLANRWGVGRRGVNDGIVLLVAPNDQKARIAVGDGLSRVLPDVFCQTIMERQMVPAFAQGRIGPGIEAGVAAIISRFTAVSRPATQN